MRSASPRVTRTHRGDDTVGLALPEGDLALGINDDVVRLASGLGADDLLHRLDLGLEWRLRNRTAAVTLTPPLL
jgi:hypothetical protein